MKKIQINPLAFAAMLACVSAQLQLGAQAQVSSNALPHNPTVINGTAVINTFSNGMQVVNSPGAILHWDSFSIGAGRTVRFDQLGAQSAVLNRVTGNGYSNILGTLQSNGRVFLLNPNGIVFGAGSVVDTAGLLASTLNISNEDFLAGSYRFRCFNTTVCESGVDVLDPFNNRIVLKDGSRITTRTAGEGGQVWLIARDRIISEKGSSIDAPSGQVMAAAAREVTVTSPSLGQMSFTLTGTAGSRIDLEGDIAVPRGAAGFFADTIRLAGGVRAYSYIGAAGQIVAQAADTVTIEGDARLSVSAFPRADAGSIRIGATRTVSVAPSVDISADGGAPADGQPGGMGGRIVFNAAEVILPGPMGSSQGKGPVQVHARGYDASGRLLTTYMGSVEVAETGRFAYQVVDGPSFNYDSSSTLHSESRQSSGAAQTTDHIDQTSIYHRVPGVDGGYALLTAHYQKDQETSTSQPVSPSNFVTGGESVTYKLQIVDAQGRVTNSHTIATESVAYSLGNVPSVRSHNFGTVALTKGGWVVHDETTSMLTFVSPNGSTRNVSVAAGSSIEALLGGGLLVRRGNTGSVYDALGERLNDLNVALANETLMTPLNSNFQQVNFDERLSARKGPTGDLEYHLNDTVVSSLGRLPDNANLAAMVGTSAWITVGVAGSSSSTLGFFDREGFTPLLQNFYESNSSQVGGLSTSSSNGLNHASAWSMGTGALWLETRETQDSSRDNFVRGATVTTRDAQSQTNTTITSRLITRTLSNAPQAGGGATASVVAPLLLAMAPGQGNGTAGGGVLPPVVPTVPDTPPAAPGTRSESELPPPSYFSPTRPGEGFEIATSPSPFAVSADKVSRGRTQAEIDAEILEEARRLVEDYMGPADAARFAAAKTAEEREPFMNEVAYGMYVGKDLFNATRNMGQEMRGALFSGWAGIQAYALDEEPGFSDGLHRALKELKPGTPNEDGSPGPQRTRLQIPLDVLELELKQATTAEDKARIGRRVLREMVLAARVEAGNPVEDGADLELPDGEGGTVRVTEEGDVVRGRSAG